MSGRSDIEDSFIGCCFRPHSLFYRVYRVLNAIIEIVDLVRNIIAIAN
jgi:hypothetical protein